MNNGSLSALKAELSALVHKQHRDQERLLQQSFTSLKRSIDSHMVSVEYDDAELTSEVSKDADWEATFAKASSAVARSSERKRTQTSEVSVAYSDPPSPNAGPITRQSRKHSTKSSKSSMYFRAPPPEQDTCPNEPHAAISTQISMFADKPEDRPSKEDNATEWDTVEVDVLSEVPPERNEVAEEVASQRSEQLSHAISEAAGAADVAGGNESGESSEDKSYIRKKSTEIVDRASRAMSFLNRGRGRTRASQSVKLKLVTQKLNTLDFLVGLLIVTNSLVMLLELQWQGDEIAAVLGIGSVGAWGDPKPVFDVLEHTFTIAFFVEMVLRIFSERMNYCKSPFNMFDALLVFISCLDLYILTPMAENAARSGGGGDFIILRFLRLVRLTRAIRIVRTVRLFRGLRVLVKACTSFLPSLCWSMTLLGMFMVMCGLILGNLLQEFILDDNEDYDVRKWVWMHYGTAYRSIYTMFELTLAGSWPNYVRPVLENVSHGYVVFFVLYIVIVVFAVIRVITAIFLKDTLDAATSDNDMMVSERLKKQQMYIERLKDLFCAADQSGDGFISRDELDEILNIQEVRAYLQTLDLEVHEGEVLFDLLDDGDGLISWDEFIQGLLRFKGQARSVDLMMLKAECMKVREDMKELIKAMIRAGVIHDISRGPRRSIIVHEDHVFKGVGEDDDDEE